jgi:RNA polymerase sigma-70 factor (ECF subfamily)
MHSKTTLIAKPKDEGDLDLIQRYLAGDASTFDEIMRRYERQIYFKCYQFVRNEDDARDLTQEVFIKAFESLYAFRGESSLKTWLYRIAINHCINHCSRNTHDFVELEEYRGSVPATVQGRLEEQEQRDQLTRLVNSLPPKQKAIVQMRMKDLSYEEIAQNTGRAVATVKATIFFAVEKLRRVVHQQNVPLRSRHVGESRA